MRHLALTFLVAAFLSACGSTSSERRLFVTMVTETKSQPQLEMPNSRYEWDSSHSHAWNFVAIDGKQPGLNDAITPEGAHKEVTTGDSATHVALGFLTGSIAGGVADAAASKGKAAGFEFQPYSIVLMEPEEVVNLTTKERFNKVFGLIKSDLEDAFSRAYPGSSLSAHAYNKDIDRNMQKGANYEWDRGTDFAAQISGDTCKEAVSREGHKKLQPDVLPKVWESFTLEGLVSSAECRVFGSITPIGTVQSDLYSTPRVAFRVDYQWIGFWVPELIKHSSLTWVVPSRWKAHKLTGRREAAFVTVEGRAWYFTRDNQNEPLTEL